MKSQDQNSKGIWQIIYKSVMPAYIEPANKIFRGEYLSAINDLNNFLLNTDYSDIKTLSMLHINLMQAYFKIRETNPKNVEQFMFHAKEALKYGHNTGLAPYRLIVGFEKQNKINKAIDVCEIVTANEYKFSIYGYKQKPEFIERLKKLELRNRKIQDSCLEPFCTEYERNMIIKNSNI